MAVLACYVGYVNWTWLLNGELDKGMMVDHILKLDMQIGMQTEYVKQMQIDHATCKLVSKLALRNMQGGHEIHENMDVKCRRSAK